MFLKPARRENVAAEKVILISGGFQEQKSDGSLTVIRKKEYNYGIFAFRRIYRYSFKPKKALIQPLTA